MKIQTDTLTNNWQIREIIEKCLTNYSPNDSTLHHSLHLTSQYWGWFLQVKIFDFWQSWLSHSSTYQYSYKWVIYISKSMWIGSFPTMFKRRIPERLSAHFNCSLRKLVSKCLYQMHLNLKWRVKTGAAIFLNMKPHYNPKSPTMPKINTIGSFQKLFSVYFWNQASDARTLDFMPVSTT